MTENGSASHLERSAPYFPVLDIDRAVRHYQDVLGFSSEYLGGDPTEFAIMSRDGLAIMLRRVDEEELRPNEAQGGTWDVFFWVRGLDSLVEELSSAGAEFVYEPVIQTSYGMKEFAVRDTAGYVLGFGEAMQTDDSAAKGPATAS